MDILYLYKDFFLYTPMYIFKSAYSCEDLNFFRRLLSPSRTPLGLSRVYMQRNTRLVGEEMTEPDRARK